MIVGDAPLQRNHSIPDIRPSTDPGGHAGDLFRSNAARDIFAIQDNQGTAIVRDETDLCALEKRSERR
jgi:hypothetical protein